MRGLGRGSVASSLALLLVAALGGPAAASHNGEASHEKVERLDGADTVAHAIAWSQFTSPDWRARPDVVLGRSDNFADSLASGTLQGALDAPLLLTASAVLDPRVALELDRLQAERIHVLGGEAAISENVVQALTAQGYAVERYSGATRIETALDISRRGVTFYEGEEGEAVLARASGTGSSGFADALGGGALAAQWKLPTLLTPSDALADNVAAYLREAQIQRVYLTGGSAALSPAVQEQVAALGIETVRLSGPDRAATAVAINTPRRVPAEDAVTAILTEGFTDQAWAAGFAAALSAQMFFEQDCGDAQPGMIGCNTLGPDWKAIVLSQGANLPAATQEFLRAMSGEAFLVCAPGVDEAACDAAAALIAG